MISKFLMISKHLLSQNNQCLSGYTRRCCTKYKLLLKIQSCKLHDNKYIASTQMTNTESFASIAVPVFNLLSRNFLFITRKDDRYF